MASKTVSFQDECRLLSDLVDELKSTKGTDVEVIEIIECWIELLANHPVAVSDMDLKKLSEFMAAKAEEFYANFKERNVIYDKNISVEKNTLYLFYFSSISLIISRYTLIYPFMLVSSANYTGFIPALCQHLRKSSFTLVSFLENFLNLGRKAKLKLSKRDIDLIKTATAIEFVSGKEYYNTTKTFLRKKRSRRLALLSVFARYYAVNFPSLGLIPYMNLSQLQTEVPSELEPYIEIEYYPARRKRGFRIFRLFLLPEEGMEDKVNQLTELGMTGRVEEWYYLYNWESLRQTSRGTWRWKLDFDKLAHDIREPEAKYNLMVATKRIRGVSTNFLTFLDVIHREDQLIPQELAASTGFNIRTIYDYVNKVLDENVVLPYWTISRIGLDADYQIFAENTAKNQPFVELLRSLPVSIVMESKKFYRFVIHLPKSSIERFTSFLKAIEDKNVFNTVYRENITSLTDYTRLKVDLTGILKDQEDIQKDS
ncbi:MAG: hypothetical protein ACFFD4_20675 [Candidatus Odinarchaeota archaeon]